jgi:hypothetical protein
VSFKGVLPALTFQMTEHRPGLSRTPTVSVTSSLIRVMAENVGAVGAADLVGDRVVERVAVEGTGL